MRTNGMTRRWLLTAGVLAAGASIGGAAQVIADARPTAGDESAPAAVDPAQPYGAHPDVSDDGRWVVYDGVPTDGSDRTSTVWLADTDTPAAAPVELTTPADSLRSGDSVLPTISGDGCVAVVVTQWAYDLFRDDDRDSRWDVYRLVLPQCGGELGDWELVSTKVGVDGETSALDAADPTDAPSASGSGAVIAYTELRGAGPSALQRLRVVDLTVPLGDPARTVTVAGTPLTEPNTTFRYHGQRQPDLSADGRYVAFTSDATSDRLEPTWGDGPAGGGFATSQVYLWDRQQPDPALAVELVSKVPPPDDGIDEGIDGAVETTVASGPPVPTIPADAGAGSPSISATGQFVAFESAATNLVTADDAVDLPPCASGCPTQVYRYDQIGDDLVLVSRQNAAEGARVAAADAGAWQPAISADGSQVAFVTKASNLFSTPSVPGSFVADGDIAVSLVDLGQVSRVSVLPDGITPAAATHGHPALSARGDVVVFDTLSAADLVGSDQPGRRVVSLDRPATLGMADLDVGTVVVGLAGPEWWIGVRNFGPSTFLPTGATSDNSDFAITGGTCTVQVPVLPGDFCTVNVVLTPSVAGPVTGTLTVTGAGAEPIVLTSKLSGLGGEPLLAANPAGFDLADTLVGDRSTPHAFDVTNIGFAIGTVVSVDIEGANPDDFVITSTSCIGQTMIPGGLCAVEVAFEPEEAGYRTATVVVRSDTGQYTTVLVNGTAAYDPHVVLASDTVRAGETLGIGGSGFAPDSDVTIAWADGSGTSMTVRTDDEGGFLVLFETRRNDRAGERQLVVHGTESTLTVPVTVVRRQAQDGPGSPTWGG